MGSAKLQRAYFKAKELEAAVEEEVKAAAAELDRTGQHFKEVHREHIEVVSLYQAAEREHLDARRSWEAAGRKYSKARRRREAAQKAMDEVDVHG